MTFFAEAGYSPQIGQTSRRMDESIAYVASGAGVGLIPTSATSSINDPRLTFRPVTDPTPTVEIVLVWDVHSLNPLLRSLTHPSKLITAG
jgi:DNA-binding transcriptional LysR family regulator